MTINQKKSEEGIIIELVGELGHHEAVEAMRTIEDTVDSYMPKELKLDLKGLTFMDSSGIAVIMNAYRNMRSLGGNFFVVNTPAQAEKVLSAAGVTRIVRFK